MMPPSVITKLGHPKLTSISRKLDLSTSRRAIERSLSSGRLSKNVKHSLRKYQRGHNHEPPLPLRVALVTTSTALCTPAFPVIGFVNAILRIAIPDPKLRTHLMGSFGSILSVSFWTILPFSYKIAPVLLPFALGNGVCAGTAYMTMDVLSGGPKSKLIQNPILCGGGIGAFTGLVAPTFCYGPSFYALYGIDGVNESMQTIMSVPFASQISIATGFVAGITMYPLLQFPINGVRGIPYTVLLFLTGSSLFWLYSPNRTEMDCLPGVDKGSFVQRDMVPLLNCIVRYDVASGTFQTYSLSAKKFMGDPSQYEVGYLASEVVRRHKQKRGQESFDDQILSLLHHTIDDGIAERYPKHVVSLMDYNDICELEDSFLQIDWVVEYIKRRSSGEEQARMSNSPGDNTSSSVKITMNEIYNINSAMGKRKRTRRINLMEDVSIAVEALITLKLDRAKNGHHNALIEELEEWIKGTAPGLVLFTTDEDEMFQDESVESQLKRGSWIASDVEHIIRRWEQLVKEDKRKTWQKRVLTTGLLGVTLGSIFFTF